MEAKEGRPINLIQLLEKGGVLLQLLQQWKEIAAQLRSAASAVDEGHRIYNTGLHITYQNFRYWLESMLAIEVNSLSHLLRS